MGLVACFTSRVGPLLCLLLGSMAAQAQAGQGEIPTNHEFWPEVDASLVLPDGSQLITQASWARNRDSGQSTWQLEEDYQKSVSPVFRPRIESDSPDDNRYLTLMCGYAELGSSSSTAGEHRGVVAATSRFPLPWGFLLDDRNRVDLRGLQSFSWRYRNRLAIRHGLTLGRVDLTPYVWTESFYDSASSSWNRFSYRAGTVVRMAPDLEIEPYFEHQRNSGTNPEILNAVGVTLTAYVRFRRSQ